MTREQESIEIDKAISRIGYAAPFGAFAENVAEGVVLPGIAGTETIAGVSDLIPIKLFAGGGSNSLPLLLVRQPDSTSVPLYQAVVRGQYFSSATFYDFSSFGTAPRELSYEYKASDLTAESYVNFGPIEEVGFAFSNFTVVPPSGNPGNPVSAPELDASSAASDVTLLVAGVVILCARRRRNDKSGQVVPLTLSNTASCTNRVHA